MMRRRISHHKDDIWRSRLDELNGFRAFRVKAQRVMRISLRGFFQDQLRASALTYFSVLSVVPVFALVFGIARGFGYEKILERQLMERLPGQPEVAARITSFAQSLLEHTQGGIIAGLGLIFLFYSVISVLMSIENYFNEIWNVPEGRPYARKVIDYLAFLLIAPVLFILASGLTVFISTEVRTIVQRIEILGTVSPVIFYLLRLSPFVTIWLLFTFMYIFMPTARVRFVPGALAALIAGTLFQLFQWAYITFQIGVSRYNAIYGSFAALPIFLVWLQFSWLIILLGAEFSYAFQNAALYDYEPDCRRASPSFRRLLSLSVVQFLARRFSEGHGPSPEAAISKVLGVPPLLMGEILDGLVAAKLLSRIRVENRSAEAYQPARETCMLTVKEAVEAVETCGVADIPVARSPEMIRISEALKAFEELIDRSPANARLLELSPPEPNERGLPKGRLT